MLKSPKTPQSATVQFLEVDEEHDGQRLDNFLIKNLKGVPRDHVYRLLRKGEIRINKGRRQASYRLHQGDVVRIPPIRQSSSVPARGKAADLQWLLKCVLYEDEALMVINKPSGLAVHGGSGVSLGLIESLRSLYPEARFLELVHRLDRDTSGCLMVAKKRSTLVALHRQIQEGKMDKRYLALVQGSWGKAKTVKAPLERVPRPNGERWVKVSEEGKAAQSRMIPVEDFGQATLVEVHLITGRTHQARVHAAHAGHPIAGDEKYGDKDFNQEMARLGLRRLFLHASALTFRHPRKNCNMTFEAPLPLELKTLLKILKDATKL
ncbi:MAG: 23S rRNA pseudouridine(955/2504/2580) synthase RluC [Gammaproteobacteria bacterium]|nr:23S rRNA pseudouridine(955/2504/2580) synthase RluC [Gammaproteobacteria bacterium]